MKIGINKLRTALTIGLVIVVGIMIVIVHDQTIRTNKAHVLWHDAWQEDINQLPCDALNHNSHLEDGQWIHSELDSMYKQRAMELKC